MLEAGHRLDVHILISARDAAIAVCTPFGVVEGGRLLRDRRVCVAYVAESRSGKIPR